MFYTEDGYELHVGDVLYNYYDMKVGTVIGPIDNTGWFDFQHNDGTRAYLNGERVCTTGFAEKRGWPA